jgi:hypothetical protein
MMMGGILPDVVLAEAQEMYIEQLLKNDAILIM